jgi:hypothetical protein
MWSSIDPGVHYFAEAIWDERLLFSVRLVQGDTAAPTDLAVIEKPQVYAPGHTRARSSDIVDLAIAAGRISKTFPRTEWVRPAQWKGQVPKRIHHERVRSAMTEHELSLLLRLTGGELKHIMDAIGIGLVHLGRL